jgi:hypothetical protein
VPNPKTRSKRPRQPALPSNSFTRRDVAPNPGRLSLKLPTDMVVCFRHLAKVHGRSLDDLLSSALACYLKLSSTEQHAALADTVFQWGLPVAEIAAWGGVQEDGRLYRWARPTREAAVEAAEDENSVVRVVIRHVPSLAGR